MSDIRQRSISKRSISKGTAVAALLVMLGWVLAAPLALGSDKKKKKTEAPAPPPVTAPDFRKIVVFPAPPSIARLKYLDYFSAERPEIPEAGKKQVKSSWMDRMAGVSPDAPKGGGHKTRFQLLAPYGLAIDSKGRLYVADTKVGAIFIFNTENNDVELIKHGVHAKFGSIFGLAMDDNDNLFVSDGELRHVLVFNAKHELQAGFGDDVMKDPNGMAIDAENRFLYVADTGLDQILVYDADSYKLLRRIGTTGKNHTLTDPGDFSKPTNVALDKDGNLYVADTWNDRIEVFDAEGAFVRAWGKNGDGPGDFARPKGIAVDVDGHIWVADAMLNRLQVFTPEGHLLLGMGSFGIMPGQFEALTGLAIDKQNRVFTSEQMLGRAQMYRYVTNAEAKAEQATREAELEKRAQERNGSTKAAADAKTPDASTSNAKPDAKPPEATPAKRNAMKLPDAPVPTPADKTPPPNQ
jgi:DNA-binding beta-propeller fold protein YncE